MESRNTASEPVNQGRPEKNSASHFLMTSGRLVGTMLWFTSTKLVRKRLRFAACALAFLLCPLVARAQRDTGTLTLTVTIETSLTLLIEPESESPAAMTAISSAQPVFAVALSSTVPVSERLIASDLVGAAAEPFRNIDRSSGAATGRLARVKQAPAARHAMLSEAFETLDGHRSALFRAKRID
jgi:hypothetical protein